MTPNRITAGDTLEFLTSVPAYPPGDGWTFKMRLVPRFAAPTQTPVTLTATASGDEYLMQVGPSTTTGWVAGAYGWVSWVEKAGARVTLEGTQYSGELTVLPDPATATQGTEFRSQAQKGLDDCKAWLAALVAGGSTAGAAVLERRIGDRSVKFASPEEARAGLVRMVNFYEQQVRDEQNAERLARGLPSRARLLVRF